MPLVKVRTPTGGEIEVMGQPEAKRYEEALKAYTTGITYTERSDFEDLEQILFMELMCWRWGRWLMSGRDYDGNLITNDNELRRWINDYSLQITRKKESLKLDRKTRESDKTANFEQRWQQLASHAREMGVMREKQLDRALEIFMGISATIRTFDRCDEEERKKFGFETEADIVAFIREQLPWFDEIDQHFRANQQRYWIRQP